MGEAMESWPMEHKTETLAADGYWSSVGLRVTLNLVNPKP